MADSIHRRRRFFRLVLLLLITIPFVPEIIIVATVAFARLIGCHPDQKGACMIGAVPVNEVIGLALAVTASFVVAHAGNLAWLAAIYLSLAAWLAACFFVLVQAWTRLPSRLWVGFAVALLFAFLPYFGPMTAIANITDHNCRPNEGGVGSCILFGAYVAPAHDAALMQWQVLIGGPLALGTFAVYAILVIVASRPSTKRSVDSV
jgi:hypothetical protein